MSLELRVESLEFNYLLETFDDNRRGGLKCPPEVGHLKLSN